MGRETETVFARQAAGRFPGSLKLQRGAGAHRVGVLHCTHKAKDPLEAHQPMGRTQAHVHQVHSEGLSGTSQAGICSNSLRCGAIGHALCDALQSVRKPATHKAGGVFKTLQQALNQGGGAVAVHTHDPKQTSEEWTSRRDGTQGRRSRQQARPRAHVPLDNGMHVGLQSSVQEHANALQLFPTGHN